MVASRICPVRSNYGPLFSLTESSGKAQTSTGPSPNPWSTMCSMLWTGSSDGRGLVYFKPHILSSAPYLLALLCISGTVTDLTWGSWVKSRITILDTQKMDLLGPLISPCQLFSIKWPQLANNHYMGTVCGTKICNVCNREPQNAWKRREESFSCRFLEYYFNLQPFLLLLGVTALRGCLDTSLGCNTHVMATLSPIPKKQGFLVTVVFSVVTGASSHSFINEN